MYAVTCATRRKAREIGGVSWYLPAYACRVMRGATIPVCGGFRVHTSGVRRMSGHTCDRQRPGHAVVSAAFPAASEDMGASSPCPTTPTHGRSVDWTCGRIRRIRKSLRSRGIAEILRFDGVRRGVPERAMGGEHRVVSGGRLYSGGCRVRRVDMLGWRLKGFGGNGDCRPIRESERLPAYEA